MLILCCLTRLFSGSLYEEITPFLLSLLSRRTLPFLLLTIIDLLNSVWFYDNLDFVLIVLKYAIVNQCDRKDQTYVYSPT